MFTAKKITQRDNFLALAFTARKKLHDFYPPQKKLHTCVMYPICPLVGHCCFCPTCPKVLIHREWCKVPDSYPKGVSGQLEHDHRHQCADQVASSGVARGLSWNTSPSAKPKPSDTKTNLIYKLAFCNYLWRVYVL